MKGMWKVVALAAALVGGWSVMGADDCGPTPDPTVVVGQGESCVGDDVVCDEGLTCLSYYGIAGPALPPFETCEIPCADGGACPGGQICGFIADGPGQVCIPGVATGQPCGLNTCGDGFYCCNKSCGICAPDGGFCTQQYCGPVE